MENTLTLDQEWVELILEAKKQGISPEEIMKFLNNPNFVESLILRC